MELDFRHAWPIFIRKKGRKKDFPENDASSRVLCKERGQSAAGHAETNLGGGIVGTP